MSRAPSMAARICAPALLLTTVIANLPWLGRAEAATSTVTGTGQVGLTSYTTLPFAGSVWQLSWGAGAGYDPAQWFWQSGTHFTNAGTMEAAAAAAAGWSARGIVPILNNQRWVDTFEASQPAASFPGEPSWIAADRAAGYTSGPEFGAWVNWLRARPTLLSVANDGGSVPADFRAWNSSWGHVSPSMPLAAADCPAGMTSCTFGDWAAYRWGQVAARSGAYGIGLSDFTAGSPNPTPQGGFNPELISAFARATGISVPAGTTASRSAWIIGNAINGWNDNVAAGYGSFFEAIANRIGTATGHAPLVIDQCSLWPSLLRFWGMDQRQFANTIPANNYLCAWDDQSMQLGRGGQDPAYGVGGYAVGAAYEPSLRNGAILEANDSAYWAAIGNANPTLSAAVQQEKGLKLLKRAWLEASWAHIADRSGNVRRALAFVSRDYWDAGALDPTLQSLIGSIVPTTPFGYALYYSTAAARAVERQQATGDYYDLSYDNPAELLAWKNSGVPVGYFVSDAAPISTLPALARPAAWLVLEHPELMGTSELASLRAVAPVLTSAAAAATYGAAPLSYTGGLTGFAFFDQNNRLIVTVTNPTASAVTGTVRVRNVPNGRYQVQDLFSNVTGTLQVSGNTITVPQTVTRWDTLVYAVSVSK